MISLENCSVSLIDTLMVTGSNADQRKARGIRHSLGEILCIMIFGFLMLENTYRGIYRLFKYNNENQEALKEVLELPHGIPSYSTLSRAMKTADPVILCIQIADFFYQLVPHDPGMPDQICVDGKTVRAAQSKQKTGSNVYILNSFSAGAQLFLAQLRVGQKKQEGKEFEENAAAILEGIYGTVTADSMSTRKSILEIICRCGNDAVLPVKGNNKLLSSRIRSFIIKQIAEQPDNVDSYVDLNGHDEQEKPSMVITDPEFTFHEEDNTKYGDDQEYPLENLKLYNELFNHPECKVNELNQIIIPECDPKNKDIIWIPFDGRWISMVKSHGRYERREAVLLTNDDIFGDEVKREEYAGWDSVQSIGFIRRFRGEFHHIPGGNSAQVLKVSVTLVPYVSINKLLSAKELNDTVRTHWNVETGHNVLDNLLYEDRCTMHAGSATENCSWLRKVVFNVLSILRQIDPQIENSENGFKACAQKYCGSIPKIVKLLSNPFSALLNK